MPLIHLKFKTAHIGSSQESQPPLIERRATVGLAGWTPDCHRPGL